MECPIETLAKRGQSLAQEQCALKFALTDTNLEQGTFRGVASVFGSIVNSWCPTVLLPGAFTKTIREAGLKVKLLHQHDIQEPIGIPTRLQETQIGLEVDGKISQTTRGKDDLILVRDGVIEELSIGFDPIEGKWEMLPLSKCIEQQIVRNPAQWTEMDQKEMIRVLREVRLWEISLVTWAADPMARVISVHAVVPFQDLPLADESRAWSASKAIANLKSDCDLEGDSPDWAKFRKAFVWYDSADAEKMGSYKLPIADIIGGKLTAVPRGIFAAGAVLRGARGGASIPDDEIEKCKTHLGRYYKKMDRTAPWDEEKDLLEFILETLSVLLPAETLESDWQIQSVLCPKKKWKTLADAKKWLSEHDYKTEKVDETEDSWRFRQRDPGDYSEFRMTCINPGKDTPMDDCKVKATYGKLKGSKAATTPGLEGLEPVLLEIHEGKVLSGKNKKLLQDAVAFLQALMATAEPPEDDTPAQGTSKQALTVNAERLSQLRNAELALAQSLQLQI